METGGFGQQQVFGPVLPSTLAVHAPRGDLTVKNEDPESQSQNDAFGFSDKSIRMGFIRKVYGILMVQLVVTFGIVAVFVLSEDVKEWSRKNSWLFFVAVCITLVMTITLVCFDGVRRKTPWNFLCLGLFTLAEAFLLGTLASNYSADSVLLAVGITAAICLGLTLFAFQTKIDFTGIGSYLFVAVLVLLLFGILFGTLPKSQYPVTHIVYGSLGAFVFSIYLVYDTQLLIGGKHKYSISPEEYIFGALSLYLDVINIFIYILSLVGSRS